MPNLLNTSVVTIPFVFKENILESDIDLQISSGLGGTFSLEYLGVENGLHKFKTKSSEYKYEYEFSDEDLPENVFMLARVETNAARIFTETDLSCVKGELVDYIKLSGNKPSKFCEDAYPHYADKLGLLGCKHNSVVPFTAVF